jgi:hypothetical protein
MSDFDAVLERLVTDPAFTSALAADPAAALSGYDLSEEEVELLRSQVSAGDAADRTVEIRTSKASMMGLLTPLAGLGMTDPTVIGRGVAHVPEAAQGWMGPGESHAGWMGPGDAPAGWMGPGDSGISNVDGPTDTGFSDVGGHYGPAGGGAAEHGLGEASALESGGHYDGGHYGSVPGTEPTMDSVMGEGDQPATGYHPHIDADGDGKWDQYTAVRHADGSVDVYEDRNHDGVVDFVGHDQNGDGVLESADYDENFDGVADTRMTDLNGDGWMDTRTPENGGA